MFSNRKISALLLILSSLLVSGCAHVPPPRIQTQLFEKPATVAIVETPPLRNVAFIDPMGWSFPHFGYASDRFFILDTEGPGSNGTAKTTDFMTGAVQASGASNYGGAGMATGALVGALIQASADATTRKAQTYHADVMKMVPTLNLREDVFTALRAALEAQDIRTSMVPGGSAELPRLRWAHNLENGFYPKPANPDAPGVDADLLVQVSPIAFWYAPGPLNNFRRHVTLAVAVYNGRTKQFLGQQVFEYNTSAFRGEYNTYGGLLDDTPAATALLRESMLSLVPQVADIIGKRTVAAAAK